MTAYLGRKGQGYIQQIGYCQRCGWKYLRTELTEDDYIKGLLVCVYCHDPDQPQRYPAEPRAEGFPPLVPAPDQYPNPLAPTLTGSYLSAFVVELSWTMSVDNADLINQYYIYRTTNGGPAVLIASVPFESGYDFPNNQVEPYSTPTVYADDTVAPGQNYTYYVVAEAVDHRLSSPSNTFVIVTNPPAPALAGFYNFTTNQVDLSWTLPGIWASQVQNYVISRSVNGGAFSVLATISPALSYVDTTANSFLNQYEYTIVAEYLGANSVPSNEITAPTIVTQTFLINGTYIKPVGAQQIGVKALGGGGGGGGSACASGSSIASSGGGGGGGGYALVVYVASAVASSIAVTAGQGGAGGAGFVVPNGGTGPGTAGIAGTASLFGSLVTANGGGAGPGGVIGAPPAAATGGTASFTGGTGATETGGAGGRGEQTIDSQTSNNVGGSTTNAGAGGGGGGYSKTTSSVGVSPAGGSSVAAGAGGAGGTQFVSNSASLTGGNGGNGISATATQLGGSGGGGGGAVSNFENLPNSYSATGGNGGNGGGYAAGGGGGATGVSIGASAPKIGGNGGNGANGIVVVTSYS